MPTQPATDACPTLADTLGSSSRPLLDADAPVPGAQACPALATVLESMRTLDTETARIVRLLITLQATGEVEDATGVALELWLSQTGRATISDRRMLQTAATVLTDMPRTMAAFEAGSLSWSQVRVIVLECRTLPRRLRPVVDEQIVEDLDLWLRAAPDDLGRRLVTEIAMLRPDQQERDAATAERGRFLSFQPSLTDEYNGRIHGEAPNAALALLADGLDALLPPPDASPRDHVGADVDRDHESIVTQGRRRLDALLTLVTTHPSLTGRTDPAPLPSPDARDTVDLLGRTGPPLALTLTCDLETLLGLAELPGHVATRLTGGRLRVSAGTARRLATLGGSVRFLVTGDDGQVLGVGRRTRIAPDWLADAVRLMFPTSIAPGSNASAAHCDLDHHAAWGRDRGRTDIDNLAPLDRQFHTAKSRGAWTITPGPGGTRDVTHPGSGWSQTVIPATRRLTRTTKRATAPPG